MDKRDYYEVLGVSRDVPPDDVKRAYRQLARQYHPDVNPGDMTAAERFKEINEAYEVLSDEQKRADYDRWGHQKPPSGFGSGFPGFGGIDEIFESFFGFGSSRRNEPRRGQDILREFEMTLEQVATGVETAITVDRIGECGTCGGTGARPGSKRKTCPRCRGTGQVQVVQDTLLGRIVTVRACDQCRGRGTLTDDPCPDCKGVGRVRVQAKVDVKIPAGVDTGLRLRVAGQGHAGDLGALSGDLFLQILVKEHSVFKREDRDIFTSASVSYVQAALGTTVQVPTLDGKQDIEVSPGTQSGQEVRLKGKGLPDLRGYGRGDEVIIINVNIPSRLSDKERELLGEIATVRGERISEGTGFVGRMKKAFGVK